MSLAFQFIVTPDLIRGPWMPDQVRHDDRGWSL